MKKKTFLTPAQKRELARLGATGRFTSQELADKFGVSKSTAARYAAGDGVSEPHPADALANELLEIGGLLGRASDKAKAIGYKLDVTLTPVA